MRVDLLSFATASAFFGATHYVNVVEQPARLALDARAMVRESTPRNRRGVAMFASLAMASALLAYVEYIRKRCALALGRDDRARELALRLFRDESRKQPVVWNSPECCGSDDPRAHARLGPAGMGPNRDRLCCSLHLRMDFDFAGLSQAECAA